MSPGELHGCSRGIYGLKSWESPRQPHPETLKQLGLVIGTKQDLGTSGLHKPEKFESSHSPAVKRKLPMLVKYSYSANKNSPLGHELSVKKGDILSFLKAHEENDSWWLAENEDRDVGYVPSSYMKMIDEATDKSWLQNASTKKELQKVTSVFGFPTTATVKP